RVGDRVTILQKPFEVVGIFRGFNVFETGGVLMLLKEYQQLAGRKGKITGFSVRVKKSAEHPDADVEAVRQQILALTETKEKPFGPSAGAAVVGAWVLVLTEEKPLRIRAQTPPEYVASAGHLRIARSMAWVVSLVAVVIGVISVLNTMAMSVLERTQEIGIL